MLAFLGCVAKEDLDEGIIEPSYYLCKAKTIVGKMSGYRIVAAT